MPHRSWPPRRALEIAQRPGQLERPHYPLAARILGFRVQGLGFIGFTSIEKAISIYIHLFLVYRGGGLSGVGAWMQF